MRIARVSLVVCCLLSVISCRGVHSVRPVPAEEDSVVDPRLIGMWEPVPQKPKDEGDDKKAFKWFVVIGRSTKSKKTMFQLGFLLPQRIPEEQKKNAEEKEEAEFAETLLFGHSEIYIHRGKIDTMCTRMTSNFEEENRKKEDEFTIERYEFKDENTYMTYRLDFDHLKKAVETKLLKGRLEPSKNAKGKQKKEKQDKSQITTVVLDDDPKKIIRYLEAHPEAFDKEPSVFQRVNKKTIGEK